MDCPAKASNGTGKRLARADRWPVSGAWSREQRPQRTPAQRQSRSRAPQAKWRTGAYRVRLASSQDGTRRQSRYAVRHVEQVGARVFAFDPMGAHGCLCRGWAVATSLCRDRPAELKDIAPADQGRGRPVHRRPRQRSRRCRDLVGGLRQRNLASSGNHGQAMTAACTA